LLTNNIYGGTAGPIWGGIDLPKERGAEDKGCEKAGYETIGEPIGKVGTAVHLGIFQPNYPSKFNLFLKTPPKIEPLLQIGTIH